MGSHVRTTLIPSHPLLPRNSSGGHTLTAMRELVSQASRNLAENYREITAGLRDYAWAKWHSTVPLGLPPGKQ